jgi:hypothetical protein
VAVAGVTVLLVPGQLVRRYPLVAYSCSTIWNGA